MESGRRKTSQATRGKRRRTVRPDVVVFEHDHARQVVSMCIDPTDEHAVFLDEAEARCRLARARDDAPVPARSRKVAHTLRPAPPSAVARKCK